PRGSEPSGRQMRAVLSSETVTIPAPSVSGAMALIAASCTPVSRTRSGALSAAVAGRDASSATASRAANSLRIEPIRCQPTQRGIVIEIERGLAATLSRGDGPVIAEPLFRDRHRCGPIHGSDPGRRGTHHRIALPRDGRLSFQFVGGFLELLSALRHGQAE